MIHPAGVHVSESNEQAGYRAAPKQDDALLVVLSWSPARLRTAVTAAFLVLGLCPLLLVPWGGEIALVGAALTVALVPLTGLMAYDLLGRRLDHTELRVSAQSIGTRHRPVPWMGNKTMATNRVRGIEVREEGQGAKQVCSVWVRLDDGRDDWLLRSNVSVGMTREQADYIALRIRAYLHLGGDL